MHKCPSKPVDAINAHLKPVEVEVNRLRCRLEFYRRPRSSPAIVCRWSCDVYGVWPCVHRWAAASCRRPEISTLRRVPGFPGLTWAPSPFRGLPGVVERLALIVFIHTISHISIC